MNNLTNVIAKLDSMAKVGNNNNIQAYIDQLIKDKHFPDLTDEVREQVKQDLIVRLDDFIAARIISALSDEEVVQFETLLKEKKPENQVQQFIVDQMEDLIDLLTETLLEFRGVYLGLDTQSSAPTDAGAKAAVASKPPAPMVAPLPPDQGKPMN